MSSENPGVDPSEGSRIVDPSEGGEENVDPSEGGRAGASGTGKQGGEHGKEHGGHSQQKSGGPNPVQHSE